MNCYITVIPNEQLLFMWVVPFALVIGSSPRLISYTSGEVGMYNWTYIFTLGFQGPFSFPCLHYFFFHNQTVYIYCCLYFSYYNTRTTAWSWLFCLDHESYSLKLWSQDKTKELPFTYSITLHRIDIAMQCCIKCRTLLTLSRDVRRDHCTKSNWRSLRHLLIYGSTYSHIFMHVASNNDLVIWGIVIQH